MPLTDLPRRVGAWSDRAGRDARHDEAAATWLGIALGITFTTCFLTGVYSHLIQHPPSWFEVSAQPAGLYRVTQGLHVATGIAAAPLLLAKLWSVYPRLFRWPAASSVLDALQRISLVPLVAGSLFMLFSGVANIELWYPLPAFFPRAHYWVAWLTIGALVVHVGAKAATAGRVVRSRPAAVDPARVDGVSRRRFLGTVMAASGLLTIATVGQTLNPLRRLALLAPRDPAVGPQGFPVNNTATEAHVVDAASAPDWALVVTGAPTPLRLSRADLQAMPQREATLPIACVEGWSVSRTWRGVSLATLLEAAGAPRGSSVTVRSLETGLYASSEVDATQAWHPDTLVALEVNGEDLALDHGFPARLIGPNRPGVMQTKWLRTIEVHP